MFGFFMEYAFLAILFLITALIYSTAGFGGGSSYIAILLLFGLAINDIRFTALLCNIAVVGGSVFNYSRKGLLDWRALMPLIVLSIPMSFIGGSFNAVPEVYYPVAGMIMIIISLLMLRSRKESKRKISVPIILMSLIGGVIGFLSGFIGIGGGILLAPILYYINWNNIVGISAATSLFILVNSFFGLMGQFGNIPELDLSLTFLLLTVVIIGGQIGNRLNIHYLSGRMIKIITGIVIGIVGIRILIPYL